MTEDEFDPLPADMMRARREMRPGDAGDQTTGQKRDTIPACDRPDCRHPAIYHGRALPRCDACDCAGYLRPARTGVRAGQR